MRPVGAPDGALAGLPHELPRERCGILPWCALARDAFGAAHLDPCVLVLEESEERAEIGMIDALAGVDTTHVVDDDGYRRSCECRPELRHAIGVDLQVPAELGEPARHGEHVVDRIALGEMSHVMEAHAAESLAVQALELRRAGARRRERHATVILVRGQQVGGGGVIEAVRCRLHHDAARDAHLGVHRKKGLLGRIAGRRIGPLRCEGEALLRAEHVEMGVASAGGQAQPGLARLEDK